MLLFIFACIVANVMGNASPTLYHYPMHLALSRQPCVRSLYENQDVSDDKTYSELKNGMQEAIADVYHTAYNSSFYKVTIAKFFCESVTEVSIEFNIALTFKDSTSNVSQTLEDILATDARFSNKTSGKSVLVGPLNKVNSPVTYNVLETEIVNNVLCKQIHMETFRNNLAKKLIVVDSNGLSSARASQIVLADHQCGDASLRFKNAKLHFFVSKSGNVFSPHKDLTELSFKVLEQMIYDGSTWKLGLALDKRVSDISLKGGDDSDKMSDVEIIYLGIGIVIILLLLIVGIIMQIVNLTLTL